MQFKSFMYLKGKREKCCSGTVCTRILVDQLEGAVDFVPALSQANNYRDASLPSRPLGHFKFSLSG